MSQLLHAVTTAYSVLGAPPSPSPSPAGDGSWCPGGVFRFCGVPGAAAATVVGGVATGVLDPLSMAMGTAWIHMMQTVVAGWAAVDTASAGATQTIQQTLATYTKPLTWAVAVIGVMIGGTRLVVAARAGETARDLARGLLILGVVTAGASTIVTEVDGLFDALAKQVFVDILHSNISLQTNTLTSVIRQMDPGLLLVFGLVGILSGMAQLIIMLLREPVLALLTGFLPVAAAASMTGMGMGWLKKLLGWIVSFTLYKFVATLIYAAAFALLQNPTDFTSLLAGASLMIIAVAALPALIRLITPAVDAIGSGGGGTAALVSAATGAMLLHRDGGRSGSQGATGPPSDGGRQSTPGLAPQGSQSGTGLAQPGGAGLAGRSGGSAGAPGGGETQTAQRRARSLRDQ